MNLTFEFFQETTCHYNPIICILHLEGNDVSPHRCVLSCGGTSDSVTLLATRHHSVTHVGESGMTYVTVNFGRAIKYAQPCSLALGS